jgi:hypothetical protein
MDKEEDRYETSHKSSGELRNTPTKMVHSAVESSSRLYRRYIHHHRVAKDSEQQPKAKWVFLPGSPFRYVYYKPCIYIDILSQTLPFDSKDMVGPLASSRPILPRDKRTGARGLWSAIDGFLVCC